MLKFPPLSRVLAAFLLLFAVSAAGAADLTPYRAEYKVKISVISGLLTAELRADESGFVATHAVKPVGLARLLTRGTIVVSSEFTTSDDGVIPVRYDGVDKITDEPEVHLGFDWSTNTASGTVGADDVTIQLDGLSHDPVSIQYALMHDLLTGRSKDTYVLFDVDKMRVADIRNIGTKTVKTKAGSFEVIGIQHQNQNSSRVMTLWCAPELGYLPVIVEQHRNNKLRMRATLTQYTAT